MDIPQGSQAFLVLNPGDAVRVSTGGTASVTSLYGAPDGTTSVSAASVDFGPYALPAKLRVQATSGRATVVQSNVFYMPSSRELDAMRQAIGGETNFPSGLYHGAYRASQGSNSPLLDLSQRMNDASQNTAIFPPARASSTAVTVGTIRSPANPNDAIFAAGLPLFRCTTAGTTGSSEPAWNTTIGGTTTDGTVTWTADKGPWFTDGVRQFRSLSNAAPPAGVGAIGSYGLGIIPWNMGDGSSLIISFTGTQNFTTAGFSDSPVCSSRTAGAAAAGIALLASGTISAVAHNDLRPRISDGTITRNFAHLAASAPNRPGDGSRHTTTICIDGRTKRGYQLGDGAARNSPAEYVGVDASNLVGWDADLSAITGSTLSGVRPFVYGGQPNADGSINSTSFELAGSRLDILVLTGRGLPADLVNLAQWFHNRGERLLPASLLL